jgi:UDP-N-acetylmuramyl tripeptide synthase
MNTAEIKLDLFRRIDNLKDNELERIYQAFLSLLPSSEKYALTDSERKAIEEAMDYSKSGETLTYESVMQEAQSRYPQLKFK